MSEQMCFVASLISFGVGLICGLSALISRRTWARVTITVCVINLMAWWMYGSYLSNWHPTIMQLVAAIVLFGPGAVCFWAMPLIVGSGLVAFIVLYRHVD